MRLLQAIGLGVVSLVAFGLSAPVQAQQTHCQFFHELEEEPGGVLLGEMNVVTRHGQVGSSLTIMEVDGYYQVYDEQSGDLVVHGYANADGSVETRDPGTRVERRGGFLGRNGRLAAFCMIGEFISGIRCNNLCGAAGVQSISYGTCGFGGTCTCATPPPPPDPRDRSPTGTFTAPWVVIDNYDFFGNDFGGGFDNRLDP